MAEVRLRINTKALESLNLLQTEGEPDVVLEITELFFLTAPSKVEKIERHIAAGEMDSARKEAHGLKSSAYSLGAELLASICQDIEDLEGSETGYQLGQSLRNEYNLAATELKKIISQIP